MSACMCTWSARAAGQAVGINDLRLEFVAVLAPSAANQDARFRDSVHESTQKLSGLEIKMGRLVAYV